MQVFSHCLLPCNLSLKIFWQLGNLAEFRYRGGRKMSHYSWILPLLQGGSHHAFLLYCQCQAVFFFPLSFGSPRDRPGHAHSCQTCVSRGSPVWGRIHLFGGCGHVVRTRDFFFREIGHSGCQLRGKEEVGSRDGESFFYTEEVFRPAIFLYIHISIQ